MSDEITRADIEKLMVIMDIQQGMPATVAPGGFGCLGSLADTQYIADVLDEKIALLQPEVAETWERSDAGYLQALEDVRKWIADEEPGPNWARLKGRFG